MTVPPMDGALKPNRALEEAAEFVRIHAPDNLVRDGDRLRFSCGPGLYSTDAGAGATSVIEVARFDSDIASLACDGAGGYAVGLDSGDIVYWGALGDLTPIRAAIPLAPTAPWLSTAAASSMCAAAPGPSDRASGNATCSSATQSGSVWAFDSDGAWRMSGRWAGVSLWRGARRGRKRHSRRGKLEAPPAVDSDARRIARPANRKSFSTICPAIPRGDRGGHGRLLAVGLRAAGAVDRIRPARGRISSAR